MNGGDVLCKAALHLMPLHCLPLCPYMPACASLPVSCPRAARSSVTLNSLSVHKLTGGFCPLPQYSNNPHPPGMRGGGPTNHRPPSPQ
ncbi:hypothetical protein GDO81_020749 [Engystomops pustulosus]|uniref:Secreted protein n=1 Tax=Engystomops pustulosus TaxID=76066 RepID=A0AAV6YX53_ENGPU|nr:hypothetical protein GDO81_020749 [Engystomops pustulosus]